MEREYHCIIFGFTIIQMNCKCVCKYDISAIVNESFIFTPVLILPYLLAHWFKYIVNPNYYAVKYVRPME